MGPVKSCGPGGARKRKILGICNFSEKGVFGVKLAPNLDMWDQNGGAKKMRAEKLCRKPVEFCEMEPRRPNIDPKTGLDLG